MTLWFPTSYNTISLLSFSVNLLTELSGILTLLPQLLFMKQPTSVWLPSLHSIGIVLDISSNEPSSFVLCSFPS